jgi:hypothetical protein
MPLPTISFYIKTQQNKTKKIILINSKRDLCPDTEMNKKKNSFKISSFINMIDLKLEIRKV